MTEFDPIDVTLFDEDDDPESLVGERCEDENELHNAERDGEANGN